MEYTDIFFVNPKSNNCIYDIVNPKINKLTSFKVKQKYEYVVYVYKNLNLIINTKNNSRTCERIESNEFIINGNMMFVNLKVIGLPLESFPLINKYHDVIKRTVTLYENNISLIQDCSNESTISFIRIENDIKNANKLIQNFL